MMLEVRKRQRFLAIPLTSANFSFICDTFVINEDEVFKWIGDEMMIVGIKGGSAVAMTKLQYERDYILA